MKYFQEKTGGKHKMKKKIVTHEAISANIEITLSQGKAEFCCSDADVALVFKAKVVE